MGGDSRLETRIPARLSEGSREVARTDGRKFGLQVGVAFLIFGGIAAWRGKSIAPIILSAGGVLVLGGIAIPAQLAPVNRAWMRMAGAIAKVTQPIFLGLLYFVAFLPVGLIMQATGRGRKARHRRAATVWKSRDEGQRRSDMSRQF